MSSSKRSNTRPATLKIHPAPFKPSHLSIPPSPFSPRTPLTPAARAPYPIPIKSPIDSTAYPPPPSPLQWLWQCHQCHRTYALGVTRRCLEDGHHFCAGTTTVKNWRKAVNSRRVKRHRACASEFDYSGWKTWGTWRRGEDPVFSYSSSLSSSACSSSSEESFAEMERRAGVAGAGKDCWNRCDYPSECRWGRRVGVYGEEREAVDGSSCEEAKTTMTTPPPTSFEGILKNEESAKKKETKGDFWGALLTSAMRRKTEKPASPLSLETVQEEEGEERGEETKDRDRDVEMSSAISSASSSSSSSSTLASSLSSLTPVTLKDIISKKTKKLIAKVEGGDVEADKDVALDPVLLASPGAAAVGEFDLEMGDVKGDDWGMEPLRRVRSRDSGYFSHDGEEMLV